MHLTNEVLLHKHWIWEKERNKEVSKFIQVTKAKSMSDNCAMLIWDASKIQIPLKVSYTCLYSEKKCVLSVGSGISSPIDKHWHQEIFRNTWKDGMMVIIKNSHGLKCEMEITGSIPSGSNWTKVQGHTNVRTHSLSWCVWSLLEKIGPRNRFE